MGALLPRDGGEDGSQTGWGGQDRLYVPERKSPPVPLSLAVRSGEYPPPTLNLSTYLRHGGDGVLDCSGQRGTSVTARPDASCDSPGGVSEPRPDSVSPCLSPSAVAVPQQNYSNDVHCGSRGDCRVSDVCAAWGRVDSEPADGAVWHRDDVGFGSAGAGPCHNGVVVSAAELPTSTSPPPYGSSRRPLLSCRFCSYVSESANNIARHTRGHTGNWWLMGLCRYVFPRDASPSGSTTRVCRRKAIPVFHVHVCFQPQR